jgi:hypothetical protein
MEFANGTSNMYAWKGRHPDDCSIVVNDRIGNTLRMALSPLSSGEGDKGGEVKRYKSSLGKKGGQTI